MVVGNNKNKKKQTKKNQLASRTETMPEFTVCKQNIIETLGLQSFVVFLPTYEKANTTKPHDEKKKKRNETSTR